MIIPNPFPGFVLLQKVKTVEFFILRISVHIFTKNRPRFVCICKLEFEHCLKKSSVCRVFHHALGFQSPRALRRGEFLCFAARCRCIQPPLKRIRDADQLPRFLVNLRKICNVLRDISLQIIDADKRLVCSALICLLSLGQLPTWVVIVIVAREFIISGFRLIAAEGGIVIAASMWGKSKTVSQMVMIIFLLLNLSFTIGGIDVCAVLGTIMIYVATALTIISLVDYLVKNKDVLKDQN